MIKLTYLLFAMLAMCMHAHADPVLLNKTPSNVYTAAVRMNDEHTLNMVVDTAAMVSGINQDTAKRLKLSPSFDHTIRVFGLLSIEETPSIPDSHIAIGDISVVDKLAVFNDREEQVDGVVGMDLLINGEGPRYVVWNFTAQTLRFHHRLPLEFRRDKKMRWKDLGGIKSETPLIMFDVKLNGVKGVGVLDTGLPLMIVNNAYRKKMKNRRSGKSYQIEDIHGTEKNVATLHNSKFSFGPFTWSRSHALIADAKAFEPLGLKDKPAMLIGVNYLYDLELVIDREKKRFTLHEAKPPQLATCAGNQCSLLLHGTVNQ